MTHDENFAKGLSVGIIMDGNGRWAKQRGLPRTEGHKKGAEVFKELMLYANALGMSSVTTYTFSTENWARPLPEINGIMKLLAHFCIDAYNYERENIIIHFIGDKSPLNSYLKNIIRDLERRTKNNTGMHLNIALNYGGRQEIVRAAQLLAQRAKDGEIQPKDIDVDMMSNSMYTAGQRDPDFILRPSGEKRLSNFMLWQSSYSEFIDMDLLWPDFTKADFDAAITEFNKRSRRFGGL
jgi:undecaprenyl diphosphate synthase